MRAPQPLDLTRSVYALCSEHPELREILAGLGFTDITTPGMLHTAGRFMTVPKGARMKNIEMDLIIGALRKEGFEPTGEGIV